MTLGMQLAATVVLVPLLVLACASFAGVIQGIQRAKSGDIRLFVAGAFLLSPFAVLALLILTWI